MSRDSAHRSGAMPGAMDRRTFIHGTAAGADGLAFGPYTGLAFTAQDRDAVVAQIARRHDETVPRG